MRHRRLALGLTAVVALVASLMGLEHARNAYDAERAPAANVEQPALDRGADRPFETGLHSRVEADRDSRATRASLGLDHRSTGTARTDAPPDASLDPTQGDALGAAARSGATLVSAVSEERVEPPIRNTCRVDVELMWVDYEGRERSYGVIPPGDERTMGTYSGHVWRLRTLDGAELRTFVAGTQSELVTCDDAHVASATAPPPRRAVRRASDLRASARSFERASLVLENTCREEVQVRWVDFHGREHDQGTIEPGATRTVGSFVGHVFRLHVDGARPIGSFALERDQHLAICGGSLRDAAG